MIMYFYIYLTVFKTHTLKHHFLVGTIIPGMFVLFVSHQWLGSEHPDPTGQQLSVLRSALRGMLSGQLSVEEDLSLGGEIPVKSRGKWGFHLQKW